MHPLAPHVPHLIHTQLREVLEKFLDDDSDMKDMNLTAKYEQHLASLQRRSLETQSADRLV